MSVRVMADVWTASNAKGVARLVLLALADHADEHTRECYPSLTRLANMTKAARSSVAEALAWLEKNGEIERRRSRGRASTRYVILVTQQSDHRTSPTTGLVQGNGPNSPTTGPQQSEHRTTNSPTTGPESSVNRQVNRHQSDGGAAGACAVIADRRMAGRIIKKNRAGYRATVLTSVRDELLEAAAAIEAVDPGLTAEQIADRLEPPQRPTVSASESTHPVLMAERLRNERRSRPRPDLDGFREAFRSRGEELSRATVEQLAAEHGTSLEALCEARIVGDYNSQWHLRPRS